MTTETIDIRVNETGGAQAAKNIAGVGQAAEQVGPKMESFNSLLGRVTAALGALGVAVGAKEVLDAADSYNELIERLKSVSNSAAELIRQEAALYDAAQKTRQSFEGTVNLYTDLKLATSDLAISNKTLTDIVTTLNKAMTVNGKTGEDVQGAMRRFAASLAQGAVDGRGLNTILLQFPVLGKAIADAMNISVGKLRELSNSGVLTANQLISALIKAGPAINAAFAKTTPTVSEAFTVLGNAITRQIGLMDSARGTTELFAQALIFLANNISTVLPIVLAIVSGLVTFGTVALATGGYITALWTILAANPFALIISALVIVTQLIFAFGNGWKLTADGQITVLGVLIGSWNLLKEAVGAVAEWYNEKVAPSIAIVTGYLQEGYKWLTQTKVGHEVLVGALTAVTIALGAMALAASPVLATLAAFVAGFSAAYAAILYFQGGVDLVKQKFGEMKDFISSSVDGISDKITKKFGDAFRDASKETAASGLAAKDWGNTWQKTTDDTVKVVNGGNALMAQSLKTTGDAALTSAKDVQDAGLMVENSMGEMVKAASLWEAQSGKYTNQVSKDFSDTASSINDSLSSIKTTVPTTPSSSGSGASQSGFTGTGFSQSSNPIGGFGGGGVGDAIKAAGGNFDAINAAVRSADHLFGTAQGPATQAALLAVINQQSEAVKAILRPILGQYPGRYPAFANGGSMTVGGSGGVDSQLVQLYATPGEKVYVTTPAQERAAKSSGGGSGSRPINLTMHIATPDANSFRRSQTQISTELLGKLQRAQRVLAS